MRAAKGEGLALEQAVWVDLRVVVCWADSLLLGAHRPRHLVCASDGSLHVLGLDLTSVFSQLHQNGSPPVQRRLGRALRDGFG